MSVLEELEGMFGVSIGNSMEFIVNELGKKIFSENSREGIKRFLTIYDKCAQMIKEKKSVGEILLYFITKMVMLIVFFKRKDR